MNYSYDELDQLTGVSRPTATQTDTPTPTATATGGATVTATPTATTTPYSDTFAYDDYGRLSLKGGSNYLYDPQHLHAVQSVLGWV
jgi:hypothetical protein